MTECLVISLKNYVIRKYEASCMHQQLQRRMNYTNKNEALARRFHMEIFRERKLHVADEILAPDFVLRNPILPSEFTCGPNGVKKFASIVADSSSEYEVVHHDTISNNDRVLI